jgi:hypothetical protein
MDSSQFDALAKAWASPSRRRLLHWVVATSFSGLGLLQSADTGATHFGCRHFNARCKRNRQCCSGICLRPAKGDPKTCQAHDSGVCTTSQDACVQGFNPANECGTTNSGGKCYCVITTGGAPFCTGGGACFPCKKDTSTGCFGGVEPGTACVVCPGCANADNPDGTQCALPCDNPTV